MINNVSRLPDAYDKKPNSNIANLLSIAYDISSGQEKDLNDINASRDISKATGKTLYYYGKMFNVARGGATEKQYRTKVLAQITRNTSTPDANGVIRAVEETLQLKGVSIEEHDMSVTVHGVTTDVIGKSGYSTVDEIKEVISSILPVGVSLETITFEGSLLIFDVAVTGPSDYPYLYAAWLYGQEAYANGDEVGLAGDGTVPNSFLTYAPQYSASGTYEGGSLSFFSD